MKNLFLFANNILARNTFGTFLNVLRSLSFAEILMIIKQ